MPPLAIGTLSISANWRCRRVSASVVLRNSERITIQCMSTRIYTVGMGYHVSLASFVTFASYKELG